MQIILLDMVMLFSSKYIFSFVNRHPTVKMLALAFLVLIGVYGQRDRGRRRPPVP